MNAVLACIFGMIRGARLMKPACISFILSFALINLGCNEPPQQEEADTAGDAAAAESPEPIPQALPELGYEPFIIGKQLQDCEGWERLHAAKDGYYSLFDQIILEGEDVEAVIIVEVSVSYRIEQVSFTVSLDEFDSFTDAEEAFTNICRSIKDKYSTMEIVPLIDGESLGVLCKAESGQKIYCRMDADNITIMYFSSERAARMDEEHQARKVESQETLERF